MKTEKLLSTPVSFSQKFIITGPVQFGKSTLIRAILAKIGHPVCGYFSQKRWNQEKNRFEIWLQDFNSTKSVCFARRRKSEKFMVDLDLFNRFITTSSDETTAIKCRLFCIDEIGFLEKESGKIKQKLQWLTRIDTPAILVVQQRALHFYRKLLPSPPWSLFDVSRKDHSTVQKEILSRLPDFSQKTAVKLPEGKI